MGVAFPGPVWGWMWLLRVCVVLPLVSAFRGRQRMSLGKDMDSNGAFGVFPTCISFLFAYVGPFLGSFDLLLVHHTHGRVVLPLGRAAGTTYCRYPDYLYLRLRYCRQAIHGVCKCRAKDDNARMYVRGRKIRDLRV